MGKRKLALAPSAYNPAAMGDIENFIKYYKDQFDVYVITKRDNGEDVEDIDGVHYVRRGSSADSYIQITADYIIDAGSITSGNKYSHSQKRISVWHGIPYKKMFVDLEKRHLLTAIDYSKNYDLMISPSKWYTERFLRQSMMYTGEVLETAISRTDSLFINDSEKKEIKKMLGIPEGKKILLYAPTFRSEGAFDLPFSPDKVMSALGGDWVIVTKVHYLNELSNDHGVIDASHYPSINNIMAISDLLITDYSSVLFDYSVLDKPALLFQYDKKEYEANRDFMFQMETYVNRDNILLDENALYDRLKDFSEIGNSLNKIKENFYPHQKENATADLVNCLNLEKSERAIDEIIFLVNNLNEIGGVHTFILNLSKQFKEKYGSKIYVFGINEYNPDREEVYIFDQDNVIDIKRSAETNLGTVRAILKNTNGFIISCQYSAHIKFQPYLEGKKSILMFHGDAKDIVNRNLYSWHLDSLNNRELFNYKKLAFLTQSNCETIKGALNEDLHETLVAIENGMDFNDSKNLYAENGEFAFVSRLDEDKNAMEVIEIFANEALNSNYKLHIYGDGSQWDIMQNRIAELNAEDRIIMHGYESNKEIIFKNKQGFISVSMTEGMPLTFLEAAKYGIPIYAYDSFTSCKDIVSSEIGVLVDPGDVNSFVHALNHPMDIKKYNNEQIVKLFSNESVLDKWESIFKEIETNQTNVERKWKRRKRRIRTKFLKRVKNAIRTSAYFSGNEKYAEISTRWRNLRDSSRRQNMPMVSIIMPFYNNNDTVEKAVRSVEKSGYSNYEILLINDGSSQDPRDVIGERDKVRYYYKPNDGLSSTRNYGIDVARGKYVFFLDSDDITFPDGLYRLVKYAEENKLKMVCGKTIRKRVNDGVENVWYKGVYSKTYINRKNSRNLLIDDTIATGKLYRTDMIKSMNIRFKDGLYEDILFTGQLYAQLEKIGIVNKTVQKWMVYGTNTSITTSASVENSLARLTNVDEVFKMQDRELMKVYYTRQYIRHQIVACLNGFKYYSDDEKKELYRALKEGMMLRKDYAVDKLQGAVAKIDLYKTLLNDDYDMFCKMAEAYSEQYEFDMKDSSHS